MHRFFFPNPPPRPPAAPPRQVLRSLVHALHKRGDVDIGALLLKLAMVTPGVAAQRGKATPELVRSGERRVLHATRLEAGGGRPARARGCVCAARPSRSSGGLQRHRGSR
jgi:hypothetical protein